MIVRMIQTFVLVLFVSLFVYAQPAQALTQTCLKCHDAGEFKGTVVHSPVKNEACERCHSPHASRNKSLLRAPERELCFECHSDIEKKVEGSEFVHQPIKGGDCVSCHAPHVASSKGLLSGRVADVCYGCHDREKKKPSNLHSPFARGRCNACHDPHASDDFRMLKAAGASLCLGCHPSSAALKNVHLGRNLDGMDCLSCHNPHGSDNRKLIRQLRHKPFAQKNCRACHGKGDSVEVCLECHSEVLGTFNVTHSHLNGNGRENPCTSCHNPHAGDRPGFFPNNEGMVCRSCHAGTFARRSASLHKHPSWNTCTDCHSLHGGNALGMFVDEPDKTCAKCHKEHSTFSHPIGDMALDPRSGQPMTCISCHDSNAGTMFKYHLRGGSEQGLCIQCHKEY